MSFYQKIKFIITKENSSRLIIFFILMLMTVFLKLNLGIALVLPAISFVIDSDLNTNSKIINQKLFFFNENFEFLSKIHIHFDIGNIYFKKHYFKLYFFLWWNKNFVEFIYRNICMN